MAKDTTAETVDVWDDEVDVDTGDRGDMLDDEKPEAKAEEPEVKKEEGEEEEAPAATAEEEAPASTDEAPPEEEGDPEPEPTTPYMVPKHRYDSAKERALAAERRALELEKALQQRAGQQPAAQEQPAQEQTDYEVQLAELDKQHAKALADGEYENAAQLASQARRLERDMYRSEMQNMTYQATTAARESSKLDQAIDVAYAKFPTLDPDSGQFDQAKTDEVLRLQGAFSAAGYSAAEALYEAVRYAFNEPEQVEAPAAAKPAPEKRTTDVKKNVEAANNQPPDLKAVGNDSTSAGLTETLPDITQLTDEEFDALPASKLRLLRGDDL